MDEALAREAARNNAEWCDRVCRAHGLPGELRDDAWTNPRRTPPSYPDAVTLLPAAAADGILARIDVRSPGCSVKDSFARLDLSGAGFQVLFEAEWIYRPAAGEPPAAPRWSRVRDGAGLLAWAAGRDEPGVFRPELLADDAVAFLGGSTGGCVASASASGVVGVSNLFSPDGDLDAAWAAALAAVSRHFPDRPIVGYVRGDALRTAARSGCRPIGPLRVWARGDAPPSPTR